VAALHQLAHHIGPAEPGASDYQDAHLIIFYDGRGPLRPARLRC
jgi:hypothetical protein